MRCHYDVLRLSMECGDDEIKKAYRKLALQWHPDKNPDRVDECTKEFHLIQQAYEVLIDPQERAWYDKHREAILRGGLGHGDKYEDNCLDVYQYFNASCYTGFGDDDKGFYAVYSDVFRQIVTEDNEFVDGDNKVPEFGNSQSSYEETVGPFYAYWECYCTARSYVWVEKYDTRDAPNRQIRRLMEQDNKKLRDKARRERNEEIRALVAFVRKRDKRVQLYKKKLEERAVEIARLAVEKKKRDREQRLQNMSNYKESSWSSMSGLEEKLKQLEVNVAEEFGEIASSDSDDDDDVANVMEATTDVTETQLPEDDDEFFDSLYCVACNKAFKSDKALDNHNRSKKHLENITRLQVEMMKDDNLVVDVDNISDVDVDSVDNISDDNQRALATAAEQRSKSKKQKKKRRQQQKTTWLTRSESDSDEQVDVSVDKSVDMSVDMSVDTTVDINTVDATADSEVDNNCHVEPTTTTTTDDVVVSSCVHNVQRPADKQSDTQSFNSKSQPTTTTSTTTTPSDSDLLCNKCRQKFTTRNKLFEHIKTTGHALRIDNTTDAAAAGTTTTGSGDGGGGKGSARKVKDKKSKKNSSRQ